METRLDERIQPAEDRTLKDLTPNVAALLCYVGGWISGIVFLVLEQKNRFIRFHALQSIIVFGSLTLTGLILGSIPVIGIGFSWLIGIFGFILWIILMVKAISGEVFKMPWAGNLAERITNDSMRPYTPQAARKEEALKAEHIAETAAPVSQVPPVVKSNQGDEFRARYYSLGGRTGRAVASSFAIAWSVVLLVFFNFYSQYIAYYEPFQSGSTTQWQMHTLITSSFSAWLPILTTTLVLTIIGHTILIVFDKYVLRQIVEIILSVFSLATVVTLLSLFPFNFNVIPNPDAVNWVTFGVTVGLIVIAVGLGIGALVRFIQLIVNTVEGKY